MAFTANQPLNLAAVAIAIHGKPMRITSTVISGTAKDQLTVGQSLIGQASQPEEIKASVKQLIRLVVNTAKQVQEQTPKHLRKKVKIPIVIGSQRDENVDAITKVLKEMHRVANCQKIVQSEIPLVEYLGDLILQAAKREQCSIELNFHQRDFIPVDQEDRNQAITGYLSDSRMQRINSTLADALILAKEGHEGALATLKYAVVKFSEEYAEALVRANRHHTRFIKLAPSVEPFTKLFMYNYPAYFDLRMLAIDVFRKILKTGHNVYIKGAAEPPSPPFIDVARTYLWDLFDEIYGYQPMNTNFTIALKRPAATLPV